jgi:hypothetical protein
MLNKRLASNRSYLASMHMHTYVAEYGCSMAEYLKRRERILEDSRVAEKQLYAAGAMIWGKRIW